MPNSANPDYSPEGERARMEEIAVDAIMELCPGADRDAVAAIIDDAAGGIYSLAYYEGYDNGRMNPFNGATA